MELPEELLRGIYAYGFEKPSAIQQRAIKPTILGRDLIAQAQSGTVRAFLQTGMIGLLSYLEGRLPVDSAFLCGLSAQKRREFGGEGMKITINITFRV